MVCNYSSSKTDAEKLGIYLNQITEPGREKSSPTTRMVGVETMICFKMNRGMGTPLNQGSISCRQQASITDHEVVAIFQTYGVGDVGIFISLVFVTFIRNV